MRIFVNSNSESLYFGFFFLCRRLFDDANNLYIIHVRHFDANHITAFRRVQRADKNAADLTDDTLNIEYETILTGIDNLRPDFHIIVCLNYTYPVPTYYAYRCARLHSVIIVDDYSKTESDDKNLIGLCALLSCFRLSVYTFFYVFTPVSKLQNITPASRRKHRRVGSF